VEGEGGVERSNHEAPNPTSPTSHTAPTQFQHDFKLQIEEGANMSNHVYKTTEVVGSSQESVEDAVKRAVARTGKTVRNMRWLEVKEIRGHIDNQELAHWQVTVKIGFTIED